MEHARRGAPGTLTASTPSHPHGRFPVEAHAEHAAALAAHHPVAILVCAFLPPQVADGTSGVDPTSRWRAARVPEYVLLGEAAARATGEHPGYERVLLADVSTKMLHYSDGSPELAKRRGGGVCCAVAFRRK